MATITYCKKCGMSGSNVSNNKECGNCGSLETTSFYFTGFSRKTLELLPNVIETTLKHHPLINELKKTKERN